MEARQIFLRDVLTSLFKRKTFIIVFTLVVFGVVFVGNYVWPPTYESTAKVRLMRGREVSQTDPTVIRTSAGIAMVQMTEADVNSEIELIFSNDVLEGVVGDLALDRYGPRAGGPFQALVRIGHSILYTLRLKSEPDAVQEAVTYLRKRAIIVRPVKDSHVLEIKCRMGTPPLARDVLERTLDRYIAKHLEVFSTPQTSPFFTSQMARVQQDLSEAQAALEDFRREYQVVSLEPEKELLLQQYAEAKRLLVQLAETETATAAIKEIDADAEIVATFSRQTDNTVVTELQLRLLELVLDRNRIVQSLGPKHPQVLANKREIEIAVERLREAIASSKAVTENKIAVIEQRLGELNELEDQLEELERAVRLQANAYEYYAQKLEESRVADAMAEEQISNIKVTSVPNLPAHPIAPRKLLNLIVALLAGLIGGVALAFFFEYLDHGLKTPEDVEHYLNIAPLASFFRLPYEQLDPKEAQRLTTILHAIRAGKPTQFVQVTSSVSHEDAGRVARALAEAWAQDPEARTLIIDFVGDDAIGAQEGPGIMDVIVDEASLDTVMSRLGNLMVIGRGNRDECPAYLWASQRMQLLLGELRQRFDRIVFYVAPVLESHDALNLAHSMDGSVFVIRADATRREVVQRAIESLKEAGGQVLGAVLTDRKQVIPHSVYRRL